MESNKIVWHESIKRAPPPCVDVENVLHPMTCPSRQSNVEFSKTEIARIFVSNDGRGFVESSLMNVKLKNWQLQVPEIAIVLGSPDSI